MGDCPCKADELMSKAKAKKATVGIKEVTAALDETALVLASIADETSADHRASLLKLESTIKFIKANWPQER